MKSHYITDLAILIFTILITGLVNPSISAVIIPILIASYFLANWVVSKAEGKKISYRDAWLLSFFLSPLVAWFVIDSSPKKKAIIIFTSVVLFFSTGTYFVNSRTTLCKCAEYDSDEAVIGNVLAKQDKSNLQSAQLIENYRIVKECAKKFGGYNNIQRRAQTECR